MGCTALPRQYGVSHHRALSFSRSRPPNKWEIIPPSLPSALSTPFFPASLSSVLPNSLAITPSPLPLSSSASLRAP
eukprot:2577950-Heterocapsa_arctica.AAC.1